MDRDRLDRHLSRRILKGAVKKVGSGKDLCICLKTCLMSPWQTTLCKLTYVQIRPDLWGATLEISAEKTARVEKKHALSLTFSRSAP